MDNLYLNNAVYLAEDFLESTPDPYFDGEIDYGDRDEHCWNGDHTRANAYSRLRYIQMFTPKIVERMMANHPPGADLSSWRYRGSVPRPAACVHAFLMPTQPGIPLAGGREDRGRTDGTR